LMTQELALKPGHRVLEIGTGSGYQAAILAMLAKEIVGVERHPDLAERAREQLHRLGLDNVRVEIGDGTLGWPDSAPFDRVMVTAAAPFIPSALVDQLAEDGRMVLPLGQRDIQRLVTLQRRGADLQRRDGIGCCFVPLVGEDGWQPAWP
ncbi:MAG: protein-L-isoaspartate O-methyltransferase, partial [Phycisphaerae bacterium]|nr:protein-L-isoaspartate O-methyltransferase [Phycisphaerae bacterium]